MFCLLGTHGSSKEATLRSNSIHIQSVSGLAAFLEKQPLVFSQLFIEAAPLGRYYVKKLKDLTVATPA